MSNADRNPVARGLLALLVIAMAAGLAAALWSLPADAPGPQAEVQRNLKQSGAENPVTAVLLNFRGYDTLLEVAVLFLGVLGGRAILGTGVAEHRASSLPAQPAGPILAGFLRVLAPVMIVVAGYLLWVGSYAAGGAFQAAALLAALGVILLLGDVAWTSRLSRFAERCLLAVGLAVFLAVAVGVTATGRRLLEYPVPAAKWLIVLIEAAATVSIAAILVALFRDGSLWAPRPTGDAGERCQTSDLGERSQGR